mmetsp:Transcript_57162/g.161375  ORF Transcript_57162/g.161375 Transcript_57162/m.161375 type:complete len:626 (-) Transcript_57162:121-1998(-)
MSSEPNKPVQLSPEWWMAYAPSGHAYYHNTTTSETTWTEPPELANRNQGAQNSQDPQDPSQQSMSKALDQQAMASYFATSDSQPGAGNSNAMQPAAQAGYDQGGHDQGGTSQGGPSQGGYDQGSPSQGGYGQGGYGSPAQGGQAPNSQANAISPPDAGDITVQGSGHIPPPWMRFDEVQLPQALVAPMLQAGFQAPSPIQQRAWPIAMAGRDLIGIAFTGSGKTLVFGVPMILCSLEQELRARVTGMEGPYGLIIAPSRELAHQTYEVLEFYTDQLVEHHKDFPKLRTVLTIGGLSTATQANALRKGAHMVVATPGRLNDLLNKKRLTMAQCQYLCLDEADRMVDLGFEEEIRNTLDHFRGQRQTLLFSATMPRKIQDFAKTALVDPIVINVGRAGAANLDVIQEVEYVKQEAKLIYLLKCLQKTPPPVLIFCENKSDVDDVHEYLLLKSVEVVAIHGGLDQEERHEAIRSFKEGTKDVLIGTDVASKGLDFPAIQHVINFDMPKEIENYVHRIGRTGRCGRTGVATTFVNKNQEETILLDLKALLLEAGQNVPPFLQQIDAPSQAVNVQEIGGVKGCAYCGGLGHRIANCPKLETTRQKTSSAQKDYLTQGSRYGGTEGYAGDW